MNTDRNGLKVKEGGCLPARFFGWFCPIKPMLICVNLCESV